MFGVEKSNGVSSRREHWVVEKPKLTTKENLGPILGERLKQLRAEHAGGDEVARSARETKLADLKKERAEEDVEEAERLMAKLSSVVGEKEIEVTDEDIIEEQEIPSSQIITSEKTPIVSGEISAEGKLKKRETNKNVISRSLYKAAKYSDTKAAEEARIAAEEERMWRARETRAEDAQKAYVKAYKEHDPKFTQKLDDEVIAVTSPPIFSFFSKTGRELKRLYNEMLKARKSVAGSVENQRIQKSLAKELAEKGKISFKDTEIGLKPEAGEALRWSAEAEERAAEIKRGKADAEVDRI